MRERRWLLLTLYGLLIAIAVSDAVKATRPKFKIATTSTTTTTEEPAAAESADDEVEATTTPGSETNATTGHTLTGIPQIDYIWDPNLPRELNGYNLSEYPFYSSMPEDIDFKCDGLHDGFYASVPHKCQVYHHCLFGTRYDFLCANFTAFDQKTFICHFVSEVDCANSKKYWHRNDALYQTASSTTTSTTTSSTTTTTTTPSSVDKGDRLPSRDLPPRRRRPPPRRPAYDYYDEDYYDDDYDRTRPRGYNRRDYDDYDDRKYRRDRDRDRDYRHRDFRDRDRDRLPMRGNRRDPARARDPIDEETPRSRVRDQDPSRTREVEDRVRDGDDRRYSDKRFKDDYDERDPEISGGSIEGLVKPSAPAASVYARPRPPPKLRRPVPLHEQDKYAYSTSTTIRSPIDEPRRKPAVDDVEEPRRRPAVDDVTEPRRRPAVDDLTEPRRRPAVDDMTEPRRRPAVDDLIEPRRRPAVDDVTEPRRRPTVDDLIEPRRRPAVEDLIEPRRRPVVDDLEEPRRRPAMDDLDEPRRRPIDTDEPRRRPVVDSVEETPRRRPMIADNVEEPRRRPADMLEEDDYYEDEMEEVRPRWQMRGRPLRDRDFPDKRYRDRPFRSRYRDEEDDVRPRKHSERSRDRFYERERERGPDRGRDRSLDRSKDRGVDRDRTPARGQDSPDKSDRSSIYGRPADRDRESERPRVPVKSKDPQEVTETPKKPNIYDRSTTEKPVATTTPEEPEKETLNPQTEPTKDRTQKFSFVPSQPKSEAQLQLQQQQQQQQQPQQQQQQPQQQQQQQTQQQQQQVQQPQQQQKHSQAQYHKTPEVTTEKEAPQKYWKPTSPPENQNHEKVEEPSEDYGSEYYDEAEEPAIVPMPPPRPTIRVIKRPFLPSRGGNPNPRGLSPVGSKAPSSPRREENPIKHYIKPQTTTVAYTPEEDVKSGLQEDYRNKNRNYDSKQQNYNNYKNNQQPDLIQKELQPTNDNYDVSVTRPELRRPEPEIPKRRPETQEVTVPQKSTSWNNDYAVQEQNNEASNQGIDQQNRGITRQHQSENTNLFSSSYKNEDPQEQLALNGNYKAKQKINEVTHHNLQDIPESEYDVTLNEALTPNLSQEPNLPSGFVLPLHRQLGRDTILQPSENTYKFSRPLNAQQHQQQKQQQRQLAQHQVQQQVQTQQVPQQSAFIPSTQFGQSAALSRNSERGKTVYFRTPETIQISGTQYRQQRGHWGDYTGF